MDIVRSEIMPGVWLSCLQTDKFKSDCISLNMLTQLDRETVSKNALIPRVLCRGTVYHPDMDSIAAACDELYGARIIPSVRKMGEVLSVGFYAGFIADRFTPDGSRLLEPVARLLGEMLLSPVTRGGLFSRDYVESEKEKLIEDIRARVNDKSDYAVFRLRQEMFAYEDYGCDDMGSEEAAGAVSYVELTRHYRRLLQTSPIEIFYCGSAAPGRVEGALRDALMTLPRGGIDYDIGTDIRMNAISAQPRCFDETMDVGQGQLVLGFRLGGCMEDPDFAAIRVFNSLYGGGTTGKLFTNVRERLSLCYSVYSGCDSFKGVMLVSAGIDFDKFHIAKEEILAQLEKVKNGEFTEGELSAARRTVAGGLRSAADGVGALESFYLSQILKGLDYGPLELAALCEDVTREDVLAVAGGIELDSVYFLHGGSGEEEEEDEVNADAEI